MSRKQSVTRQVLITIYLRKDKHNEKIIDTYVDKSTRV